MTSPQRPRPPRPTPEDPNPARRGLLLVVVAVALGVILLIKGGGVGFQDDAQRVNIGSSDSKTDTTTEESAPTTAPAPATSVPAAQLKIAVLNAAGINGFASTGSNFLSVAGYPSATPGNAAAPAATSSVYFAPGFEADATAVAKLFSIPTVAPIPETPLGKAATDVPEGTQVVVVLGPDVEPVIAPAGTATTAPTTAPAAGN